MVTVQGKTYPPKPFLTVGDLIKVESRIDAPIKTLHEGDRAKRVDTIMAYAEVVYDLKPEDVELFKRARASEFTEISKEVGFVVAESYKPAASKPGKN